jgi:RND family efflux transporter MFP subunit
MIVFMKRVYSALLIISLLVVACKQKQPPPIPPVPVNVITVKAQNVFYYDKYPANTVALSQVDLRPEVQGYITEISFIEGTHVHKGQILYTIDQRLYQQAYDQAKANVDVAEGNLKQAQQDADRYVYLNSYDAVAKQTLDHATIALENAKKTVLAAEQTVKMAATNLTYSVISAPFDGTIGFSQVKLGNMVTVGTTVLNTVSSDDPMAVDFLISEKQLTHFEDLKNSKQKKIDSLFTITLPNDSIYPYLGKISIIDRAVDPQTGTIRVRVVFPNPNYGLKPGTSCILRVHNQENGPKLLIPSKATVEVMGEYFVYLAKDSLMRNPEDSTKTRNVLVAVQKKVQIGATLAPNVIIKNGIKEGDRLIVDGVQSLHTGSLINSNKGKESSKAGRDSAKAGQESAKSDLDSAKTEKGK